MQTHLLGQHVKLCGDVHMKGQAFQLLSILGERLHHLLQVTCVDVILVTMLGLMLSYSVCALEVIHFLVQQKGSLCDVLMTQLHPNGVLLPKNHLPLLLVPFVRVYAVLEDVVLNHIVKQVEAHAFVRPLVNERSHRVNPPVNNDELTRLSVWEGVYFGSHLRQLRVQPHRQTLRDQRPLARTHGVPFLWRLTHLEADSWELLK
mmetsp:Transcript_346/g.640  ORF Transcript_346/g.640 Transcript_346/m.640 type:complete len:204 (-) Transcript_346:741-1352(-)